MRLRQHYDECRGRGILPKLFYPLACATVFLVCIVLAHPFAGAAFNDDWSYSRVALKFAETGRLQYNGWGSPTILFQALWGAAWIRTLGFSFDVLRAATIPFSLGFILVVYALGVRVGLTRQLALFGSLTVGTSPLFLPLASSFMTDVYGCFFLVVGVYAAIAVGQSKDLAEGKRWLWILAASGILGGSNRQIIWIAPLVLIPYARLLHRSQRSLQIHALAAYAMCLAVLALVLIKLPQPYAPLELSPRQATALIRDGWFRAITLITNMMMTLLLVALPAFLCFLRLWRGLTAWQWAICLCSSIAATAVLAGLFGPSSGLAPFGGNILTPFGILKPGEDALGVRPQVLALLPRVVLTASLWFNVAAFVFLRGNEGPTAIHFPLRVFRLVSCFYILLLFPGALVIRTYDRYMLPLLPFLVIFVLLRLQPLVKSTPVVAWLGLCLFAGYGIATTHDYFQSLRARVALAEELQGRGIASTQISAGFEYDGWTQLQATGRIEAVPYGERVQWNVADHFGFWAKTPAITPNYVISYWSPSALPQRRLSAICFTGWLPPFHHAFVSMRRSDLPGNNSAGTVR